MMSRRDLSTPAAPTTFVRVRDDVVDKATVDDTQVEADKVEALHELGQRFGFHSPALRSIDQDRGRLTLERVPIGTPLTMLLHDPHLRTTQVAEAAFRDAGRVLGVIHDHLDVEPTIDRVVPAELAAQLGTGTLARLRAECATPGVIAHGDFGTSNLFVAADGQLTVLDPMPNGYSSFHSAERGSRYLDLALMDTCLLGRGPARTFIAARPQPMVNLLHQFLEGYESATGVTVDVGLLREVSRAVLRSYLRRRRAVPDPIAARVAAVVVTRQESALMGHATGSSYRQSHQTAGYGRFYDDTMFSGYFGGVWRDEERPALRTWLREARRDGATHAIDMACGTGRITEVVAEELPNVLGIDISTEMLAQAALRCAGVPFLERDITREGVADLEPVDVATAFRFFMNAEPDLRDAVIDCLHAVLRPGGVLITNVQCNAQAPAGLVQRFRRRVLGHGVHTMSVAELTDLLGAHGFTVERIEWMAYWPRTGPYLSAVAQRMQRPARRTAQRLGLPDRYTAGMFMVRARRT